jgi:serine/threonine protein kinase
MNIRSLLGSLFNFGGTSKVHVWQRFEPIGEGIAGTMSRFYKARDKESGNTVGLKLPNMDKVAPIESRFKGLNKPTEGEIGQLIVGDHVVKTLEHGKTHDGGQFIVQNFLDGMLVHFRLKRGDPLSLDHRIDLIRQTAQGVAAVHEAGFVHRDICPRNLMMSPEGKTTLFDFGLSVPNKPAFLRPGNRTGTPNYMAPEVIRRRQSDHRLDIFSFGVTAYEICSGTLPWPGGDARAALAHDTPVQDIRELDNDIPDRLAEAIMDCLKPDPENRHDTMEDFLRKIARLN